MCSLICGYCIIVVYKCDDPLPDCHLPDKGGDESASLEDCDSVARDSQPQLHPVVILGQEQLHSIEIESAWGKKDPRINWLLVLSWNTLLASLSSDTFLASLHSSFELVCIFFLIQWNLTLLGSQKSVLVREVCPYLGGVD